jgi:hypothetical protein
MKFAVTEGFESRAFVVRAGRAEAHRGASPVPSSDLVARRPGRAGSDCRLRA